MINKTKSEFTEVTSVKKAYAIKAMLKKEGRFINVIRYPRLDQKPKYYIFYYNLK